MIQFTSLRQSAPDGTIIGVIQEDGSDLQAEGAATLEARQALPQVAGNYIFNHTLARASALEKAEAVTRLVDLRRKGATIAVVSHDELLLESCSDEIWWLRGTELIARGDPGEVLDRYRRHIALELKAAGDGKTRPLSPTMRSGDGRAVLESLEILNAEEVTVLVVNSGEKMTVRVTVRFAASVQDPVIGIMIRTRIGLHVYGTNTELEQVKLGPAGSGDTAQVTYTFPCDLCPGDYTITAASHDPDGVWHDWMEDAAAFAVTDSRYTAGVANLKAQVSGALRKSPPVGQ